MDRTELNDLFMKADSRSARSDTSSSTATNSGSSTATRSQPVNCQRRIVKNYSRSHSVGSCRGKRVPITPEMEQFHDDFEQSDSLVDKLDTLTSRFLDDTSFGSKSWRLLKSNLINNGTLSEGKLTNLASKLDTFRPKVLRKQYSLYDAINAQRQESLALKQTFSLPDSSIDLHLSEYRHKLQQVRALDDLNRLSKITAITSGSVEVDESDVAVDDDTQEPLETNIKDSTDGSRKDSVGSKEKLSRSSSKSGLNKSSIPTVVVEEEPEEKPQSSIPKPELVRPCSLYLRSLCTTVSESQIETPTPRSPLELANTLCPFPTTKLFLADLHRPELEQYATISTEPAVKQPELTMSDIRLNVRTKSMEAILVDLSRKITTLLNSREKSLQNDKQLRAIVRIGQSVNFAVERFAAVGEAIAEDNAEIRAEMFEACKDARAAGSLIEQLCSLTAPSLRSSSAAGFVPDSELADSSGFIDSPTHEYTGGHSSPYRYAMHRHDNGSMGCLAGQNSPLTIRSYADKTAMSRAARALLSSVTRVLLVADTVVVKQLIASKDRISMSLNRLENVANFTEFVKAFSNFGAEMIELAQLTNDRQNDIKNEKRRAQMATARRTLERSTMMLLTSTKACLRHPDCHSARINRDTVFTQMRRAMDLIHYVVKEGVIQSAKIQGSCHLSSATGYAGSSYSAPPSTVVGCGAGAHTGSASPVGHYGNLSHFRPTSTSSSSSSSLHLPFDPQNDALLYGSELDEAEAYELARENRVTARHCIPKYERRGQLHRTQQSLPNGSFVLAVESTLKWLHEQLDTCPTIVNLLRRVLEMMELARMGPFNGPVKEQMVIALEAAIERTQDFTDSADTNHAIRERILLLCDQIKAELSALFRAAATSYAMTDSLSGADVARADSPNSELETCLLLMSKLIGELCCELQDAAIEQAAELLRQSGVIPGLGMGPHSDLPMLLKSSALDCDPEQVDELGDQFREYADHVREVCRLLFHVAPTPALQITAGHTETAIEIHAEQLLTALTTLSIYPASSFAQENYDVFAESWSTLITDLKHIMREISEYLRHNSSSMMGLKDVPLPLHPMRPQLAEMLPYHLHPDAFPPPPHPLGYLRRPPPLPPSSGMLDSPSMGTQQSLPPMTYPPHIRMQPTGPQHGSMIEPQMPMQPPPHGAMQPQYRGPMHGENFGDHYTMQMAPITPEQNHHHHPHHPHHYPHAQDPNAYPKELGPGNAPPPSAMPPVPPGQMIRNGKPSVHINPEVDVVEIAPTVDEAPVTNDIEDNDIVRKAKALSTMVLAMFQFTRGEGELKTTQDLFTQAEFFADEANRLYKIVRHFTYQIPAGTAKKELLDCIDEIPTYVQQLQFAVKNVTVGKTATFTKVDNVITETKNLMSVITRVVAACLNCANKYNVDMQGALKTRSRTLSPSYRGETDMFFEGAMSKGMASSDSDIRQFGMNRRGMKAGEGDARRTRVSFLLY